MDFISMMFAAQIVVAQIGSAPIPPHMRSPFTTQGDPRRSPAVPTDIAPRELRFLTTSPQAEAQVTIFYQTLAPKTRVWFSVGKEGENPAFSGPNFVEEVRDEPGIYQSTYRVRNEGFSQLQRLTVHFAGATKNEQGVPSYNVYRITLPVVHGTPAFRNESSAQPRDMGRGPAAQSGQRTQDGSASPPSLAMPVPPPRVAPPTPGGAAANLAMRTHSAHQMNANRPGADFRNIVTPSADACQLACQADARCMAWTWVRADYARNPSSCWLKSAAPPTVPDTCCVSGMR